MNTGYKTILAEYLTWLDTLGYSDGLQYACKVSIGAFFEWLEEKQIQSITLLTDKHISEYHNYLETRPNKLFKGRMLSVSHLNHSFLSLDKLLEFLHQYGMTSAPVPTNRRIEVDKQARILNIQIFTQEEIKTLYNCILNKTLL